MKAFVQVRDAVKTQLFAAIPGEYAPLYKDSAFKNNLFRFITQCLVLVILDCAWLFVYSSYYKGLDSFSLQHVYLTAIKIAAMLACFFYLVRIVECDFACGGFAARNMDTLFPALHMLLEILLFVSGPKDIGTLLRFALLPFAVGSIPVLRQDKSFALLLAQYLFGWYYINTYTMYTIYVNIYGLAVNYWLVAFIYSVMLSFTVYSWSVNAFMREQRKADSLLKAGKLETYNSLIEYADKSLYIPENSGSNRIFQMADIGNDNDMDVNGKKLDTAEDTQTGQTVSEEYMKRVLSDISADCTFIYDGVKHVLEFSATAVKLYGLPRKITGPALERLPEYINIVPEEQQYVMEEVGRAVESCVPFIRMDAHVLVPDGSKTLVAIRAQCAYGEKGRLMLMYGSVFSIQKIMEYNQSIGEYSYTNSITQLPNRQQLNNDLKNLLKNSSESGYLILVDINNFREINSTYSHNIGDKVLYETARHLSKLAESVQSTVYNYNVDQFIIIMHDATEEETRRMMGDIDSHFRDGFHILDRMDMKVEFTMLAVDYDCYTTILDELFVDLDIAKQYAKFNSVNGFFFLTDDVRKSFLARIGLSNALKRAVENDCEGFMLYYQPIFDNDGCYCLGAEALLRWKDAEENVIPPNVIIPELEKAGLMPAVEQWVFRAACEQCAAWIAGGAGEDFFMHINLSPASIGRPTLPEEVLKAINENGLELKNVVFEAIETSAIFEMKTAVHSLASLKNKGIRIAIDDFGTGYSSLSYLSSLPADEIKIDRYFLNNIDKNPSNREFLNSIIGLAKSMDFLVCIEGVETAGQYVALKDLRVDYLQGFFFGKPVPAEMFYRDYIDSNNPNAGYPSAITSS